MVIEVVEIAKGVVLGLKFGEGAFTYEGRCLALGDVGGRRIKKNCGELLLGSVERVKVVVGGGG